MTSRSVPGVAGQHRIVDLALLAVAITWGSSYLAAKQVASADSVFAFLTLRFGLAAVGLALLLAPRLRGITRGECALGAVFGLILSLIFTLETFGVTGTSASNAGLIISLTIVMTPLLEQYVRRTAVPAAFYGATLVAVAGVAVLTQSGGLAVPSLGDLLMLLAAAVRAIHVTVIARFSAGRTLDSSRVTLVQLVTALGVFTGLSTFIGRDTVAVAADFSVAAWLLTVYLALAGTVFAFFIQMWAVRRTSPARVSLLLGTEPLWAAVVGVGAGDPLTALTFVGAALILIGTNWGRAIDTRQARTTSPPPESEARPAAVAVDP
ncbi:EamA family transporter [Nocardia sp. R6R-6]|uniref:EamA family transporter n=1 Tax=Nocardia sp. R6R-6 TaxID=3459303 RepID=UPI00403D6FDA